MRRTDLLVILIPLAIVFYFIYVMMGWNFIASFTDWDSMIITFGFVGFEHYAAMFGSPIFITSFWNTVLLFLGIPLCILFGLIIATLLDQKMRGASVFRSIYLLPFALSFVVTATMWKWMYNPTEGVLNSILPGQFPWTTSSDPAILVSSLILVLVWQFTGYATMILLAGMKAVPESRIEAAKIDGASGFRLYRKIIYPNLKAPLVTSFVVLLMFFIRAAFDLVNTLTGGGPGTSSYTLPLLIYKEAFVNNQFAYGAAIAVVLLAIAMVIVIPYLYKTYR